MFEFKIFDNLTDKEIDLRITEKVPANLEKNWVPAYKFNIYLHDTNTMVGYIDIRIGYTEGLYYGGHIGYTILEEHRGNNFAYKACKIVKQVAVAHEMTELFITCVPNNTASRKTIEKLGLTFKGIYPLPEDNDMYKDGKREVCIFSWDIMKN